MVNQKLNYIFLLLASLQLIRAQIIDIVPQYGLINDYFMTEELWNVDIVTQQPPLGFYYVTITLENSNHQTLLKSKTKAFQFNGTKIFNILMNSTMTGVFENEWVDVEYYRNVIKNGKFLLPGTYKVVYTVLSTTEGCNWVGKVLMKKEITLKINYFNRIELLYPLHQDTIHTRFPTFMWLPIAPYDNTLTYSIKVVENKGDPNQDIFLYLPYLESHRLSASSFVYPSYARQLEKGKRYAWQVVAYNDKQEPVAYSEVFQFYVQPNVTRDTLRLSSYFSYIDLQPELEGTYIVVTSDTLFISISNPLQKETSVQIKRIAQQQDNQFINVHPKLVWQQEGQNNASRYLYYLDISDVKPGIYELTYDAPQKPIKIWFILQKKK